MNPRLFRLLLNFYPPYLGAGIRVTRLSADFIEAEARMHLRWYNRKAVGTRSAAACTQ